MTDAVAAPTAPIPSVGRAVTAALLMGLSISVIGTLSWVALIRLNVREHSESPWAAATTACWLVIMLVWLSGHGWPRSTSAFRHSTVAYGGRSPAHGQETASPRSWV